MQATKIVPKRTFIFKILKKAVTEISRAHNKKGGLGKVDTHSIRQMG